MGEKLAQTDLHDSLNLINRQDIITPLKVTWNLKMMSSKRNLLFQGFIFRFYVSFRWCNWNSTKYIYPWNLQVIYLPKLRLPHWGWCRFLCNEPFLWLEFLDLICQHSKGCTTLRRDMKLLSALPKQQMLGWEVMFKDCGHCRTPWLMKKNRSNDLLRRFYFTKSLLKVLDKLGSSSEEGFTTGSVSGT